MADITFILDNGDGTVRVKREPSWNTPDNKPNQVAKIPTKDMPDPPDIPAKYMVWDGAKITEAPQAVKDQIDAAEAAELEAIKDAKSDIENLSDVEKSIFKEIISQIETLKAAVRNIKDAALGNADQVKAAVSAMDAAAWKAAIKDRL